MDEKDLFNKDTMYWREVNASSAELMARLKLKQPIELKGEWVELIECKLMSFESHDVEYEMENGGAFKKNEVKSWPFVLKEDIGFYEDESSSSEARLKLLHEVSHELINAIELIDANGDTVLIKAKI